MPQLRVVVLALQDRLGYGPTFESAMAALFGGQPSTLTPVSPSIAAQQSPRPAQPSTAPAEEPGDVNALILGAARDLADYQRLTAEGKLGEAGLKLEALKQKLDALARRAPR